MCACVCVCVCVCVLPEDPSMSLILSLISFNKDGFDIKLPTNFVMPLNDKNTKPITRIIRHYYRFKKKLYLLFVKSKAVIQYCRGLKAVPFDVFFLITFLANWSFLVKFKLKCSCRFHRNFLFTFIFLHLSDIHMKGPINIWPLAEDTIAELVVSDFSSCSRSIQVIGTPPGVIIIFFLDKLNLPSKF